jgi:GDP/UDP-N,N'-diacetylbacillosamine 2-epimerase (hydrolysing)
MKICVVTGTRAEYGLLRWVMEGIKNSASLELQVLATGMHLSPEFGMTVDCIEADGFRVDRRVEMLLSSDTAVGVAKSTGLATISIADALHDLAPDLLLLLGDRYELLASSIAALIAKIPIAHLHGGEKTEGAFDEAIRHSITKMSHLHFVAAEEYRKRVIQLGENPQRVFNVGGMGIDNIKKLTLLNRTALENELNYELKKQNFLITFHPVTLENSTSEEQMGELLDSLGKFEDCGLIFTMPNSDTGGRILLKMIEEFCYNHKNAISFTSLGQLKYLSCLNHVNMVIGNSSSGLLEVPTFKIPTINIGDRQKGRLKAKSVIDCLPTSQIITASILKGLSDDFKEVLNDTINPYGEGGASQKIIQTLESIELTDIIKKKFYDIEFR